MTPDQHLQSEIEQLEQRFAENPQGRVFAHLADVYRQARRLEEAEALVVEGLKRHPNYVSAYLVLGRVYSDWGRREQAVAHFTRVLELDAQNLVALRALGDLAAQREVWDEARGWYDRVLQIDPYNDEVKQALAKLPSAEPPPAPEAAPEAAEADSLAGYSRYGEEMLDAAAERPSAPTEESEPAAATEPDEGNEGSLEVSLAPPSEEAGDALPPPPPPPSPPSPPAEAAAPLEAPAPRAAKETDAEAEAAPETEVEITPVTETMAELYAEQGLYEDAIDIYRELSTRRPEETRFAQRIEELQRKIRTRSTLPRPLPTGPDEPLPRERPARQPVAPAEAEREPPSPVLELEADDAVEPAGAPEPESGLHREPAGPSTDWMEASPAERVRPLAGPGESDAEVDLPNWLTQDEPGEAGGAAEPEPWETGQPSAEAEPWSSTLSTPPAESDEDVALPDWLAEPGTSPAAGAAGRGEAAEGEERAERGEAAEFSFRATARTEELKVRDPFAASFEATAEPRPAAPAGEAPAGAHGGATAGARAVAAAEPGGPSVVAGSGSIGEYVAMILSSGERLASADRVSSASAEPRMTPPASAPTWPAAPAGGPASSGPSPAARPAPDAEPRSPQVPPPSPDVTQPAPAMGGHPQGGESEDDLAQFQSWLRSLKR